MAKKRDAAAGAAGRTPSAGHKRGPFCAVTLPTGSAGEQASATGTRPDPSDAERGGPGRLRETRLCWPPGCRRGPAAPTGTGRGRPRAEVAELRRHRALGAPQPARPWAAAPGRVAAGAERPLFAGDPAPRIRALGGLGSPTGGRSVPHRRGGQGAAALPARAARCDPRGPGRRGAYLLRVGSARRAAGRRASASGATCAPPGPPAAAAASRSGAASA